MQQDIMNINQPITLPDGSQVMGYVPIDGLNQIDAIYNLAGQTLSVSDHGALTNYADDEAILAGQAPAHALVASHAFTGTIALVEHSANLHFENNQLVSVS